MKWFVNCGIKFTDFENGTDSLSSYSSAWIAGKGR